MSTLKINDRFKNALPPLTETELRLLESSLVQNGCVNYIVCWNDTIVDGHNRYELCNKHKIKFDTINKDFNNDDEAELWIRSFAGGRRNLSEYSKLENEKKINELELKLRGKENIIQRNKNSTLSTVYKVEILPTNTQKIIAKKANVSTYKVAQFDIVAKFADEKIKQKLRNNEVTINKVYKEIKNKQYKEKESKQKDTTSIIITNEDVKLYNCDILDSPIKDNSLDIIITDPPYPREFLSCWSKLAEFASKKLKDGGVLIAACGHIYLPEIFNLMNVKGLTYYWTECIYQPGKAAELNTKRLQTNWKPLLVYTKGEYKGTFQKTDVYISEYKETKKDKEFHEWGQNHNVFSKIVTDWTYANSIVCDPFLGGGTTGVCCIQNKRKFVGIEINKQTFDIASERLNKEIK